MKLTIIYPYVRIPRDIQNSVPDGITVAKTESGWMNSQAFFEYIVNVFDDYLAKNNVKRPVILFIYRNSSHLTMQLSVKCEELEILLYLLPPNTKHLLQPADVDPFKPLKAYWRQHLHQFQRQHPSATVKRRDVAPMLSSVLKQITSDSIINGFHACGLSPFYPDAVDYSKCLDVAIIEEQNETDAEQLQRQESPCTVQDYESALKVIDFELGKPSKNLCYNKVGLDAEVLCNLYANILRKVHLSKPMSEKKKLVRNH